MNWTLYKKEMKGSLRMLGIFAAILTMYVAVIVGMYNPEMLSMLDSLAKTMPELMAAFGMSQGKNTLIGFLISYLYGFILLVFPMVFSILMGNALIAGYCESGAMVTLLSAPVKRTAVAVTQMLVLISGVTLLVIYTTVLEIVSVKIGFPEERIAADLLKVNIGLLALQLLIGSICFLFSCAFSDTKLSLGFGAGIPAFMFLLQMLANAGEQAEKLKYASLFTLFDPTGLAEGDPRAILCALVMALLAALFYGVGVAVFRNRDLSI